MYIINSKGNCILLLVTAIQFVTSINSIIMIIISYYKLQTRRELNVKLFQNDVKVANVKRATSSNNIIARC